MASCWPTYPQFPPHAPLPNPTAIHHTLPKTVAPRYSFVPSLSPALNPAWLLAASHREAQTVLEKSHNGIREQTLSPIL